MVAIFFLQMSIERKLLCVSKLGSPLFRMFLGSPGGKLIRKKSLSDLWRLQQKWLWCSFVLNFMIWNFPSNEVISDSNLILESVPPLLKVFLKNLSTISCHNLVLDRQDVWWNNLNRFYALHNGVQLDDICSLVTFFYLK